jgi:hypothetical protein
MTDNIRETEERRNQGQANQAGQRGTSQPTTPNRNNLQSDDMPEEEIE